MRSLMHCAVPNSERSLLFLQKEQKHTRLGSTWKEHVTAMVPTWMKYETQTLNFTPQIYDLQLNQLHATVTWHLCKAPEEDHRNLILLNGAPDTGISSTISRSFSTLTRSAWDQTRQTRSRAQTPALYHLLKSKTNGNYLVQGSPPRRKQGFSFNNIKYYINNKQ